MLLNSSDSVLWFLKMDVYKDEFNLEENENSVPVANERVCFRDVCNKLSQKNSNTCEIEPNHNYATQEEFAMRPENIRRGRPRAEVLNTLILAGSSSASAIKCRYCFRVFPREKSLQAHLRTHTG